MKTLKDFINEELLFKFDPSAHGGKYSEKFIPILDEKDKKYHPEDPEEINYIIKYKAKSSNKIDLTDVDISKLDSLRHVGYDISKKIEEVDISNWDTSNIKDVEGFFAWCGKLKYIKGIEDLNTSNFTNIHCFLAGTLIEMDKKYYVDFSKYDLSKAKHKYLSIFTDINYPKDKLPKNIDDVPKFE